MVYMVVDVVYEEHDGEIEISREEFDRLIATIETLEDQDILSQLEKSASDKKDGRLKSWDDLKESL